MGKSLKEAHAAIQELEYFHPNPQEDEENSDDENPTTVMLNGWVLLSEWVDVDTGEQWFTMRSGDATGDGTLARWRRCGLYETAKQVDFSEI